MLTAGPACRWRAVRGFLVDFIRAVAILLPACALVHDIRPEAAAALVLLLPGLALYVLVNGALLFGPGLRDWLQWCAIVGASAAAWAMLVALISTLLRGWRRCHPGGS